MKLKKLEKDDGSGKKMLIKRVIGVEGEGNIKAYFPFFYKHRVLRVFLPIYRLGKGLIIHPERIINEVKNVRKFK